MIEAEIEAVTSVVGETEGAVEFAGWWRGGGIAAGGEA